jgi:hypothetical protein
VMCSCLSTKSSHMGVATDGLACPLHRPMACSHHKRGRGSMPGVALSYRAAASGGALPRNAKPLDLDICSSVDRLGTCIIEF